MTSARSWPSGLISLLLLVFESDVGMSAVLMGLFVAMLYVATSRTSWLLIGFVLFVVGAASGRHAVLPRRRAVHVLVASLRIGSNWNNACYQPVQGLYGMANGGLLGKGLGGGSPS